ncbi:hypothetical protein Tco_0542569 [Tanacetum coccineum]
MYTMSDWDVAVTIPDTHIPLRPNLGVLQIGIRANVIENQIGENYHGAPDTSYARHEEQIKTILNHLDELPLERIENMEDKIEGLEQIRHYDEIVLARVRTSTLEILIEDIQVRHRSDMKNLLNKIHKLKNHKGGPPDY